MMNFGPDNDGEALVFAIEELRADVQYDILRQLKAQGLSQAKLAARMGVSAAWVSQLLSDDANLTVESIAKVYFALGKECQFGEKSAVNTQGYFDARAVVASRGWVIGAESGLKESFAWHTAETNEMLFKIVAERSTRMPHVSTCNDNCYERTSQIAEVA